MSKIIKCSDATHVRTELTRVVQQSVDSAKEPNLFTVGVSGGSLITLLSQALPLVRAKWDAWNVFFCDERLVEETDPESTFGEFKKQLLSRNDCPLKEQQFHKVNTSLDGKEAADDYEKKMKDVFGSCQWPAFDLLLLGMGPDGHTASLFPGQPLADPSTASSASSWVSFVANSPKPPPQRVTLTLPVINNARNVAVVATGASKAEVLKEVLEEGKPLPVGLVKPNGQMTWILDTESGRLLTK